MTKVSEAITQLEQALFVGRDREIAIFRDWLLTGSTAPAVLCIWGPGGVGKTTVLHAFRRVAQDSGRTVLFVDGRDFPATPEALLAALGDRGSVELDSVASEINRTCPVILFDTFEAIGGLGGFLRAELLPRLDTRVRVVIAGRRLPEGAWPADDRWAKVSRRLQLEGFTPRESLDYLHRRGIENPEVAAKVASAAGGSPLALSLAADLVLQFNIRDFTTAAQWHLAVRALAERLLHDVRDPVIRELLEACAVVHQFDEATLAAVSGRQDVSAAFDQLCRLSTMRPSEHGLQLHDDVARHLAADLNWRQPQRYNLLRMRALAHYRERLRSATPRDREWLVVQCFYLWSNALIQQVFFTPGEPAHIRVRDRRPNDDGAIRRLFEGRYAAYTTELGQAIQPAEGDRSFLEAILESPGSRIRVATDEEGAVAGFSTVVPISRQSLPILRLNPGIAALINAHWGERGLRSLPGTGDASKSFCLAHIVHGQDLAGPVRAALLRDISGLFALGGTYLCSTLLPSYKNLLEACGFARLTDAQIDAWGTGCLMDGYVLDLSRLGFERWIEAMINGRQVSPAPDPELLEKQLQGAFTHWKDDAWLAQSPLFELFRTRDGANVRDVGSLRGVLLAALADDRARASGETELAYRALHLAYLSNGSQHKQLARQLSVSRATFYRLVRRGIHALAESLTLDNS